MKDYVVTFNGIECGEDVYEPVVIKPSEPVKMYICVSYTGGEVAHTSAAYADKSIAESLSQFYQGSKIVEVLL